MSLVLFGPVEQKQCEDLRATAEAHPLSLERLLRAVARAEEGDLSPDPQNQLQTIILATGHTITFTVEEWPKDITVRRFSMASPDLEKMPHPVLVELIIEHFGYVGGLKNTYCHTVELQKGGRCVEIIQPLDGDINQMMEESTTS